MMPADGKLRNYITSLWTYIEQNFTAAPVYFSGYSELDTTKLSEWVEFLLTTFVGTFQRQIGVRRNPGLVANFYLRKGTGSVPDNGLRWTELHDALNEVLGNAMIPVYDYAGGNGSLRISQINVQGYLDSQPVGTIDDLFVVSDSVDLDFIESHYCS